METPYYDYNQEPWMLPQDHDELEVDYEQLPKGCLIALAIAFVIAIIIIFVIALHGGK